MAREPRVKPFGLEHVQKVRSTLEDLLRKAQAVEELMTGNDFKGTVDVDGGAKVFEGMKYITSWLHAIHSAYDIHCLPTLDDAPNGSVPREPEVKPKKVKK